MVLPYDVAVGVWQLGWLVLVASGYRVPLRGPLAVGYWLPEDFGWSLGTWDFPKEVLPQLRKTLGQNS